MPLPASSLSRLRALPLTIDRQEEQPFLSSLGAGIGSGLHYVGTTLNKPSRAIWSTLEGLTSGDWEGGGVYNLVPFLTRWASLIRIRVSKPVNSSNGAESFPKTLPALTGSTSPGSDWTCSAIR